MKRPFVLWLLFVVFIVLALGGLAGAWGFFSDPSGAGMEMDSVLGQLPVPDYTLPGILLIVLMFITPLVIVYGLIRRPVWNWMTPIVGWSGAHWSWMGSLILGLGLAIWLAIQAVLIGFDWPIQWFTAALDLAILCSLGSIYYGVRMANDLRATTMWAAGSPSADC